MSNNTTSLEILKLNKVSINNIDIIKEHVSIIEIFESLMQPGITGYIDIMDYQGLVEIDNIFAGDDLTLEFITETPGKKPITNKFKIYSNEGNKLLPQQSYNVLRLGFCSEWLIDGLTKVKSKFYKNKYIHEIIKDLLEECGATVGYIEPTKQKLENFVTPLWSPYHSIKHLLSFALSKNNTAGYLCWTDLSTGKVNVTTVDYLLKGSLGKFKTFMVYPANPRYEGKITNCSIETNYDIIRLVNNGLPKTKVFGFNFDKGKVFTADKKVNEYDNKHISKKIPIPSKYENYSSFRYSSLFPNNKDSIADNDDLLQDLLDGSLFNEYAYLSSDMFKINIIAPGETGRRVGWLAEVDFPSQNVNAGDKQGNKQLKGDYLIRDIKHSFSFFVEYKHAITLVADGYKEFNKSDMMSWTK